MNHTVAAMQRNKARKKDEGGSRKEPVSLKRWHLRQNGKEEPRGAPGERLMPKGRSPMTAQKVCLACPRNSETATEVFPREKWWWLRPHRKQEKQWHVSFERILRIKQNALILSTSIHPDFLTPRLKHSTNLCPAAIMSCVSLSSAPPDPDFLKTHCGQGAEMCAPSPFCAAVVPRSRRAQHSTSGKAAVQTGARAACPPHQAVPHPHLSGGSQPSTWWLQRENSRLLCTADFASSLPYQPYPHVHRAKQNPLAECLIHADNPKNQGHLNWAECKMFLKHTSHFRLSLEKIFWKHSLWICRWGLISKLLSGLRKRQKIWLDNTQQWIPKFWEWKWWWFCRSRERCVCLFSQWTWRRKESPRCRKCLITPPPLGFARRC